MPQKLFVCDGDLIPPAFIDLSGIGAEISANNLAACSGSWVSVDAQSLVGPINQAAFESLGITSSTVFEAFAWGFGLVVSFWFAGYVISVAKTVISKA